MKHVFTLMLFFGIFSCNIDQPEYSDLHTSNNFPQKWELIQVRFPSENLQQKGLKMAWQESYLLLPDSTFLKKRMTPAETITAEGKFILKRKIMKFTSDLNFTSLLKSQQMVYFQITKDC